MATLTIVIHTMKGSELAPFLEQVYRRYHRREFLGTDPLEFTFRYAESRAREVEMEAVAIVSALLAYGNVKQIRGSAEKFWERALAFGGGTLAQSLQRAADPLEARALMRAFEGFTHRFNPARDWVLLWRLIAASQAEWGSVGARFCRHLRPEHPDFSIALDQFVSEWMAQVKAWDPAAAKTGSSFRFLLNSPLQTGSCCKRWCMLMRWLGRKDALDPGLWQKYGLSPRQLVMPLDTHTGRLSQYLGLTRRKSLNWKAAREITDRLSEIDPADPTRFDFSLCRIGILKKCRNRFVLEVCQECELVTACRLAKHRIKKTPRPLKGAST